MRYARNSHPGFSLGELVIVVAIVAIVAAIAVIRMAGAAAGCRNAALTADLRIFGDAIERYAGEHGGRTPADNADATVTTNAGVFTRRLVTRTDDMGDVSGGTQKWLGPYLKEIPVNPFNRLATVRIDGNPAGTGQAGWRFDTAQRVLAPDDTVTGGNEQRPIGAYSGSPPVGAPVH